VIRKSLLGVAPLTRLGPEGYTPSVSQHVYRTVAERALRTLRAGHAVVADAVFGRAGDRETMAAVAREAGVPFIGLWLEGPPEVLATRLQGRGLDVSDATPEVLARQRQSPPGRLDWHTLDASMAASRVLRRAETICREAQQQPDAV
jgi:predicted kinase